MNQVTDTSTNNFTTLTFVKFLLFDLTYERLYLGEDLGIERHALCEVILSGNLFIVGSESSLVLSFFLYYVSLL